METKTVTRYYCEHCRKGSFRKSSMLRHEASCIANPQRVCDFCKDHHLERATPLSALIEICLNESWHDANHAKIISRVESAAGGCPICTLAAMKQARLQTLDREEQFPFIEYDWKAQRAELDKNPLE